MSFALCSDAMCNIGPRSIKPLDLTRVFYDGEYTILNLLNASSSTEINMYFYWIFKRKHCSTFTHEIHFNLLNF